MPTIWQGSIEERLARMEKKGKRCDANSRRCPRSAVEEFDLQPADGEGHPKPDAELVTKKCCSFHRQQFLHSGSWILMERRPIAPIHGPETNPHRKRGGDGQR